jgi:hypothetical protein
VDTATLAEVGTPLVLSAPLSAAPGAFTPSVDRERNHLLVPVAAPGGAGTLCFVDLDTFTERDAGPAAGVDGLPIAGAGPCVFEELRDVAFVLQSEETTAAIVRVDLWDLETDADPEVTIPGRPRAIYATGDAQYAVQGLDGYAAGEGLVKVRAGDTDEGFPVVVPDDGGAGSIGATRVGALLRDPGSDYLWVFADNGVRSVLSAFDGVEEDFEAVDLDPVLDGLQGVDLQGSVPSPVNGATVLRGYP